MKYIKSINYLTIMQFPHTIIKRRFSRIIIEKKIHKKNLEINCLTKDQGPYSCEYMNKISQITTEKQQLITKYNHL
jgi:hypothetical protein